MGPENVTYEVKSAVNAYLMARANAETHRAKVDDIARKLLAEVPIQIKEGLTGRRYPGFDRITEPKYAYLMSDVDAEFYYAEKLHALRKSGYEIEDIPDQPGHYKCPACCAEHLQVQTEWLLIEEAARMINAEKPENFNHRLLCDPSGNGLGRRQEFIDLVVKMVLALPDFKNPLTGELINEKAA